MPLKKPKPVRLPAPFADQESSDDSDRRRRALLMKRELAETEGFSWNTPRQGLWQRLRGQPVQRIVLGFVSLGIAGLMVSSFLIAMDSGIEVPERIVFMQSWRGDRSAADAVAEREEAMDRLKAQIEANRAALAAQQAREKALAAERAAARQATS